MASLQNYNGRYCESDFESTFLTFLEAEGWQYLAGSSIVRDSKRDVLYADDLEQVVIGPDLKHCPVCGGPPDAPCPARGRRPAHVDVAGHRAAACWQRPDVRRGDAQVGPHLPLLRA